MIFRQSSRLFLLGQLPDAESVSQPQEEQVLEHLDRSRDRVEFRALDFGPLDRHLSERDSGHFGDLEQLDVEGPALDVKRRKGPDGG